MKTYPVMDRLNETERKKFGISVKESLPLTSMNMPVGAGIRAVYTGEKRRPKKGEWYLSGSIVEAYRAPNDLSTVFHIARLVRVETTTTERIVAIA